MFGGVEAVLCMAAGGEVDYAVGGAEEGGAAEYFCGLCGGECDEVFAGAFGNVVGDDGEVGEEA